MVRDVYALSDKYPNSDTIMFGEAKVENFVLLGRIVHFTKSKNTVELTINDTTGQLVAVFNKLPSEDLPVCFTDQDITIS